MENPQVPSDEDYESLLRRYEINPLGDRSLAAASLMRVIAFHLSTEKPLPKSVRNWLSRMLINGAEKVTKEDRLQWVRAAVRPAAYDREATEFAHVYALMQWGWKQDPAAQAVATFFARADVDAANTKKRSNRAQKIWIAEGPIRRSRPESDPPEATEQHLRDGEDVVVLLHVPGRPWASELCIPIKSGVLAAISTPTK